MHPVYLVACSIVVVIICGQIVSADESEQVSYPPASLSSTEVRTVHSSTFSRDYQIYVSLPWSYGYSPKRYPTLYMTDADLSFARDLGIYQSLQSDREIPEMILVGIGYGTAPSSPTWSSRRTEELTPSAAKDYPGSGHAAMLSRFIREELIPFIDTNYRTDPTNRTLTGGSFGALFGLYVMLQTPGAFQQYVARSPSVWWDNRMVFELEREYAASHQDLPAMLFTSIGLSESPRAMEVWKEFVTKLEGRNYPNLRIVTASIADARHSTAIAAALVPGLKAALGGLPLQPDTLDRYVGRYSLPQGIVITVTRGGQKLLVDWNGLGRLGLVAHTPTRFTFIASQSVLMSSSEEMNTLLGLDAIDFHADAVGSAHRITVFQAGQKLDGKRDDQ